MDEFDGFTRPTSSNSSANRNSNNSMNRVENNNSNSDSANTVDSRGDAHTRMRQGFEKSFPSSPNKKRPRTNEGDRFIPSRDASTELWTGFTKVEGPLTPVKKKQSVADRNFTTLLRSELFGSNDETFNNSPIATPNTTIGVSTPRTDSGIDDIELTQRTPPSSSHTSSSILQNTPVTPSRKIFHYLSPRDRNKSSYGKKAQYQDNPNRTIYSLSPVRSITKDLISASRLEGRELPSIPYRVLDAPGLAGDFYLNLLDWGQCNMLAVALASRVYLWSGISSEVTVMHNFYPTDTVTSLRWVQRGTHLAVGTHNGSVEIWDAATCKKTRTMSGHTERVGALSWNDHVLSSGGRDNHILHRDVRAPEHYFRVLTAHRQEVCGLEWNSNENLLASGGNDNALMVWDKFEEKPLYSFHNHIAAVKAITWSPHQRGILASGGGTADRTIKLWNTQRGSMLHNIDTGSQVCNLLWSKQTNEFISTHGFMENEVALWNYPSVSRVGTLKGHTDRVLYLAMSPNGENIVTGAADETLRFWKLFDSKSKHSASTMSSPFDPTMKIR
ncbi:WD repeat-containing protein srw1 [Schizosaccharomyces pombe]|uniref:WD repeat-containing protein srw1 n=1 Tax=Schizosaccharomyces pombe (strain 972 / ATCC 24843) TaxID=284812 RepID=SRW1_SCHPO|nr:CDK inhibitor Srw1 [Schizosaccharomyces pombe]O13286.1 RecName: Full=WD repeat-containing protein srw1; AltName: Full=Suppressor of rad/wee1 [Schizosaccharomyces pombe 972h-]BAA22152.1 Srw1 [Schizosaccharomyces pombe]BAF76646.1 Ste9 [Schizosaccharomyces pombe]CAB59693.1 CDK inhibitor Srw1 [Schizosaccharomyces pombe]|eukprot:NP_594674.1 CDK inhibitor Srw1 [Schizosaccharomyces pombe]